MGGLSTCKPGVRLARPSGCCPMCRSIIPLSVLKHAGTSKVHGRIRLLWESIGRSMNVPYSDDPLTMLDAYVVGLCEDCDHPFVVGKPGACGTSTGNISR